MDDAVLLEELVRGQISYARAHGLHIYLSPVMAAHARRLGLWDDAVHVETKPLPKK